MNTTKYILLLGVLFCMCVGCKTGIEGTKTITLSKSDRRELMPTAEELLMEDLKAPALQDWEKGKRFLICDQRVALVFDNDSGALLNDSLVGNVIEYEGVMTKATPGSSDEAVLVFGNKGRHLYYSTGKTLEDVGSSLSSMDVPMVLDLDMVDRSRNLLVGRKVWTRSQLWYDKNEDKIQGRKFVPVVIKEVEPGNVVFPLRLTLTDDKGNDVVMFMNVGKGGMESRSFKNLFSLTDPKDRYPNIQKDVWELIQQGKVKLGMTKDECKLALGNPDDVVAGHDWNSTIDIWQYTNGAFLRFADGLLVDFK